MPLSAFPKCFIPAMVVDKTMSVYDWIDICSRDLSLDGVEFYWGFVPHDVDEQRRVRDHLDRAGIPLSMMCYTPDFTVPDPAERRLEVEKQAFAIATTARLGGRYCRVLSGQRRPDVSREQGIEWVAESIRALLPVAEKHGVTLIIENHYKDAHWRYPEFAQKSDVFLSLLDRVGPSPWFGVNFDPSNALVAGDDPVELLRACRSRVVTMHASDRFVKDGTLEDLARLDADGQVGYAEMLVHGVIGEGAIDYDAIFAILREDGFKGWISIEDGNDPEVGVDHLAQSAAFLRAKMNEYSVG